MAIISFIILLIIITRFVYIYFFVKVKTECAQVINFNEFIDTKALIIRDEEILKNNSKFLKIICSNNSKVAKNQVIARLYESENLLNLDNKINFGNLDKLDLSKIEDINTKINYIIKNMIHNKILDYNILNLIKIHEKILNNKQNLEINQDNLNNNNNNINNNINFKEIKSEYNGIFSDFTDGFENLLNLNITDEEIQNLNFELYSKLNNNNINNNIFGKIIKNNNCMILCYLNSGNNNNNLNLDLNQKNFKIKFELNSEEIDCEFKKILELDNNKKIMIFYSNINNFLINSRLENAKIKIKSDEGIKINKKYLHNQDNKLGVFVLDRKIVKFKLVDISYETDKFVICHVKDSDPDFAYLKENDLIITSGHNLYDNKILRYY